MNHGVDFVNVLLVAGVIVCAVLLLLVWIAWTFFAQRRRIRQLEAELAAKNGWVPELVQFWTRIAQRPQTVVDQRIAIERCVFELQEVARVGFIEFMFRTAGRQTGLPPQDIASDGQPGHGKTGW